MTNPLLFACVIVALIAFGLVAGCKGTHHRCASYDEWEELIDKQLYRIEAYPCACRREVPYWAVPYWERHKIATA